MQPRGRRSTGRTFGRTPDGERKTGGTSFSERRDCNAPNPLANAVRLDRWTGRVLAGHLSAQEAVLNEFYGSGVHNYFAGNLDRAVSDLIAAINGGSKDPRAFYYRALAKMKLGQQDSATLDLSMGATLETADVNQFYPVGKALERIQGSTRAQIERYRAVARAEVNQPNSAATRRAMKNAAGPRPRCWQSEIAPPPAPARLPPVRRLPGCRGRPSRAKWPSPIRLPRMPTTGPSPNRP